MKSCNLSLRPPAASHTRSLPLERSADTDMEGGGGSRPEPAPAPPRDCSVALVHDGGRATFDDCSFRGSPLSYGVVARDSGTRVSLAAGRDAYDTLSTAAPHQPCPVHSHAWPFLQPY